jgi:hypothetical protein
VVGRDDETGITDVLHAWIRHATVNEMWDAVWAIDREFHCGMGVEINMFQDFLLDSYTRYAETAGSYVNLHKVTHKTEKIARIVNRVAPLMEFGKLRFCKGHSNQDLLVEQLIYIMDANVNDDGPDALEGALSLNASGAIVDLSRSPERREAIMRREGVRPREGFFGRFRNRTGMREAVRP